MFDLFCSFTPYQDNTTSLYLSSQNGHNEVVQSLLREGANVNTARSDVSDMMFNYIMTHGHMNIVLRGMEGGEAKHVIWVCLCLSVCESCACV